jgi:quercetin dioxygenase-like cupin family protein
MAGGETLNIARSGEGTAIWFAGNLMTVKSPSVWSEGGFSLVEALAPRGRATPLHRDPSDESFYVLEGELCFHVEGEERLARAGDTIGVRRGTAHAFVVRSEQARFLVLNTPGTHDAFFAAAGEPAERRELPPSGPPDMGRMMAAATANGIEILGPPPFAEGGAASS